MFVGVDSRAFLSYKLYGLPEYGSAKKLLVSEYLVAGKAYWIDFFHLITSPLFLFILFVGD